MNMKKIVASVSALALTAAVAVGGTLAWLTDQTDPEVNTFTVGNINIDLTETTGNTYKIVPGKNITKDPKVSVTAKSDACWLFVKVEEENWPTYVGTDGNKKVSYTIAEGWTALDGVTGVYYREVNAETATAGAEYTVLADNRVTVSSELNKTEIDAIAAENPVLTFTAYAVQTDGMTDAKDAWTKAAF